ncbi:hypothetical protein L6452_17380 [Arctium lappa]|uniref:Uncharacterized protein n=1 Tax=Arctium lappa TaxID=4217 RepID=A0ACB9C3B0_ARCLA|nr:hypothetical protein L6452_17380 [Arctium lappa]
MIALAICVFPNTLSVWVTPRPLVFLDIIRGRRLFSGADCRLSRTVESLAPVTDVPDFILWHRLSFLLFRNRVTELDFILIRETITDHSLTNASPYKN